MEKSLVVLFDGARTRADFRKAERKAETLDRELTMTVIEAFAAAARRLGIA